MHKLLLQFTLPLPPNLKFESIVQQNVRQEPFELEPVEIEEIFEQCNPDLHNGCQISTSIEEYSYEYQIEDVILVGKGVSMEVEKSCASFSTFNSSVLQGEQR